MNAKREKRIQTIIDKISAVKEELDVVRDEEQEWYDGHTSDAWQDTDNASISEEAIDMMGDAVDSLDEAVDYLSDIVSY